MSVTTPRLDAKLLYRRLDSLLGGLDRSRPQRRMLESFLEDSFAALKDDLRLRAAFLYGERRDGFQLVSATGEPTTPVAEMLDPSLPPMALVLKHSVYIFADPASEDAPHRFGLLPEGPAAALVVGRRPHRSVYLFRLADEWVLEELDFVLNTLRAALGSRLMEERMRGRFREAAEIQQSLLDEEPPAFPGYEMACRSVAAEEVGGDFFDFYPFGPDVLGFAIGDASGHGLPAALLVRDVVTGLRMGLEKSLKMTYVFSKLNRVIHRSTLSSRFVSVFYGELEQDGGLIYCNAGHQPPLLISEDETVELATGGTVIGPLPEARFRRGFVRFPMGGLLVLCTDGILERRDASGEFFGVPGLERVVRARRTAPVSEILEAIFTAAFDHGEGRPWEDDATAVILRRTDGGGAG